MAVSFGLDEAAALRGLTSDAAAIIGAEEIGRLAPGCEASFFAADGDILDIRTNVTRVIMRGTDVAIDTKHTRLRDEFAPAAER